MLIPAIAGHQAAIAALSNAWTPATPGDLKAWWDASDTAKITSSSNLVSQHDDSSGNGFHMTASGSARPTTNTDTVNGKNAIKYATNNQMASTGTMGLSVPFTFHWIGSLSTTDTFAGAIMYTGNNGVLLTLKNTTGFPFLIRDGWNAVDITTGANYDTSVHLHSVVVATGTNNCKLYMDGTLQGSGSLGAAALPTSNQTLLGFQFMAGDMCEAWVGTTAQGSTTITSAHGYAQAKWASV